MLATGALAQGRSSQPSSTDMVVVLDGDTAAARSFDAQLAAQLLLGESDLVAVGEFADLSDADSDGQDLLSPRLVTVSFRLLHVYKGSAMEGTAVRVELNSDMLVYPGDDVSRYSKRLEVRRNRREELRSIERQIAGLDDARRTGALSEQRHTDGRATLDSRATELRQQALATSSRQVVVSHGDTFYDYGVLTDNTRYLVGLQTISTAAGTYGLDDLSSNRNIYWGELAEDVGGALSALTR